MKRKKSLTKRCISLINIIRKCEDFDSKYFIAIVKHYKYPSIAIHNKITHEIIYLAHTSCQSVKSIRKEICRKFNMNIEQLKTYKAIIFDGNNLVFRYKRPPFNQWKTTKGEKTGIIHGALNTILSQAMKNNVDHLIVCWDSRFNFRREIDKNYKSNRDGSKYTDEDQLSIQIETLHQYFNYFGITSIALDGYESDDLCYSAAKKLSKRLSNDELILVISNDDDFDQIVNKQIHVMHPKGNNNNVFLRKPHDYSWLIYNSLMGQKGDVIEKVNGFDKKISMNYAKEYKNVKDLIRNCKDDIIKKNKQHIIKNYKLVKMRYVDVNVTKRNVNSKRSFELLDYYELKKIKDQYTKFLRSFKHLEG